MKKSAGRLSISLLLLFLFVTGLACSFSGFINSVPVIIGDNVNSVRNEETVDVEQNQQVAAAVQPQARVIKTIVRDGQTHQPIPQAQIEVTDVPADQVDLTPEPGIFEIKLAAESGVDEPALQIKATAPGYIAHTLSLNPPQPSEQQTVEINLEPTTLVGRISDAVTGEPLAAAIDLTHDRSTGRQVDQIESDSEGRFEALRLEPPIHLQIDLPGYEPWQTQLDAADLFAETSAPELDIALTPRQISGILRAADTAQPLAGVTLEAGPEARRQTVTTAADGSFDLQRLQPGDPITVEAPAGYAPLGLTYGNQPDLALTLHPDRLIVLAQDMFSRQPVANVRVTLSDTLTGTTNAAGRAEFSQPPAAGQLAANHAGYQPVTVDYQNLGTLEIALIPTALQGVIRDGQTGQPLPQAELHLGDGYLQADANGHFTLEYLPEAATSLRIKTAGYHRAYAQLAQTGLITGTVPAPFSGGEGRWLATAPCAEPLPQNASPCLDFLLTPFEVKAIYIPFNYLRSRKLMQSYLDFIEATELNAFVVDVKGDFGFIGWESNVELAATVGADRERTENWMPLDELIIEAKKRNIYAIARLVVFKDDPLAHGKPELAVVREDGSVWIDGEELGWANPFREEVWDYNIALAEEVAAFGFDELNFDYIRFPSDGDVGAIVYEEENTRETRTTAIREFMQRLTGALRPYGVFTSADVFGLTVWVTPESDMNIGQRVIDIAPSIDYLAPMVYPSTFIPGNLGYENPSAEPYGVVFRSQEKAEALVPPYVKVRPWLQGYWYSLPEMQLLKQGANDAGSIGWSWWNAGGKYDDELFAPAQGE